MIKESFLNKVEKQIQKRVAFRKKKFSIALAILAAFLIFFVSFPYLGWYVSATLSVLVVAAILWITEAIPLHATAFLIVILTVVFEIHTATTALAPFFSPVIALLLGGFIISIAIEKYGLGKRASNYILTHTGTKPKYVLLGLIFSTAFLSFWMSNTATTAIMIVSILPIINKIPKEDNFKKAMILAIPFAANAGGVGTPVGTPPNPIAIKYLSQIGVIDIYFLDWMIFTIPITILFLFLIWFVLIALFPSQTKCYNEIKAEIAAESDSAKKGFTKNQLIVLVVFIATVLLWLTEYVHGVSIAIIALMPVVFFLGTNLLTHDDFNQIQWNVLFLIGGGLTLSGAIQASGLANIIVENIDIANLALPLVMFLFAGIGVIMTTFMSNTATAALLIPIVGEVGYQIQSAPFLVLAVAVGTSMAMSLPVSTAPNAIAYGTGKIKIKDMIKAGAIISILSVFLLSIVGYLWWSFLSI